MSRDAVKAKCDFLGVRFCQHHESVRMRIAGWYHYLAGNPLFNQTTFVTIYPWIFTPDGWDDPLESWETIDHECVHWVRQRDYGVSKWVFRYLTSWEWRYREERIAFLRDVKNGHLTVDQVVYRLRGSLYGVQTPAGEIREWFDRQMAVRVPERSSDGV